MSESKAQGPQPIPTDLIEIANRRDVALGQLEVKLLESMLWDGFGGTDLWFDIQRQRYGDGQWVPFSVISDRRDGANWPIFRTEAELAQHRQRSRIVCQKNAYAISLLGNLTNYLIGEGFTYRVQPRKSRDTSSKPGMQTSPEDQAVIDAGQAVVDAFLACNRWTSTQNPDPDQAIVAPSKEREAFIRLKRDGETILRLFYLDDGKTAVRFVEPEQVTDPPDRSAGDGWSFGMRHCTEPFEDEETIEEYFVKYKNSTGHSEDGEYVPADEIVHLKPHNQDATVKRGFPAFSLDTLDAFERASKLQRNVSASSAVRAATAEIWKHQQASASDVSSMAQRMAERTGTNPVSGKQELQERLQPGSIRRIAAGMDPVWPQAVGAEEHLSVVQGDLRQAVAAFNAPEYFTGDASNANYASTKEAGSPFVQASTAEQGHFKAAFAIVILRALRWAMKQGKLPGNFFEVCELQVETPAVSVRDKLQKAQVDQIYISTKVKSVQTTQMEEGLDPEHELANIEEFDERNGSAGGGLGSLFGGDGGGDNPPTPRLESIEDLATYLLESGFTGTITDAIGRHVQFQDGKRIKGSSGDTGAGDDHAAGLLDHPAVKSLIAVGKKAYQTGVKVEHAITSRIEDVVSRLPDVLEVPLRGTWAAMMATYTLGQAAVEAVAKERGLNEAQTQSVLAATNIANLMGAKGLPLGAELGHLSGGMAFMSGFVPIGSLSYLCWSTAKDPLATLRAAHKGVKAAIAAGKAAADPLGTAGRWLDSVVESEEERTIAGGLAELFARHPGKSDDVLARFAVALDMLKGDFEKALAVVDRSFEEEPADESREDLIADIMGGWAGPKSLNGGSADLEEGIETPLLEAGFTGTITDRLGRKITFQDGKRVKGQQTPPAKAPKTGGAGDKPKAVSAGRAEKFAKAKGRIDEILKGNVTPELHAELLGHLGTLTIPQLKALRDEHGLKAKGRLKAELVQSIGSHFKQQMLAHGSVDVEALKDKLKPYGDGSVEIPPDKMRFAKARYETMKSQYGTLLVHRLEEVADDHLAALEDLPKGAKADRANHQEELAITDWMLGRALRDGINGQVEDASLKDFGANLDRISLGERLKGTPWSAFLLRSVRERFAVPADVKEEQLWNRLKEGKYKGPRMDEALAALRTDYGTMTQQQLFEKVLPKLKDRRDTVGEKVAAGSPANPPKTGGSPAKPPKVGGSPAAKDASARAKSLFDDALTSGTLFDDVKSLKGDLAKLTIPQLKEVAASVEISNVPKTKGQIVDAIGQRILDRREMHERGKVGK